MKVVVDTNVLVAALLNPRGIPADILNLVLNEEVTLCYDNRIIGEYRSVLKRDKFCLDHNDVDTVIDFLEEAGIRVDANPLKATAVDPDDAMFYKVLESSGSDFLVTGNTKHFAGIKDKRIVTPAEFMKRYFK